MKLNQPERPVKLKQLEGPEELKQLERPVEYERGTVSTPLLSHELSQHGKSVAIGETVWMLPKSNHREVPLESSETVQLLRELNQCETRTARRFPGLMVLRRSQYGHNHYAVRALG